MVTFQELLRRLSEFWAKKGCAIHQPYDLEMGAGTFHPATILRCLGPEPYRAAYAQPSRRPTDGRYGENPNRVQRFFQYQVILKPSPLEIQDWYLESLEAVGFDLSKHDIRFVHDDWEAPTLGASGLGWEVWMDGMEVTQFTYFQTAGGIPLKSISGELTYGVERLAMYMQGVDSIFDLQWSDELTYGDIYHQSEVQWSTFNFDLADTEIWFRHFDDYEHQAKELAAKEMVLPAFDFVMKASHAFNILDARGVISVTERTGYIARIRELTRILAETYEAYRETLGHPLLNRWSDERVPLPEVPYFSQESFDENQSSDFLLEIGCEELPTHFVDIGMRNLKNDMEALLKKERLSFESTHVYGTPRRLAILIKGLSQGRPSESTERRGPRFSAAYDKNGQPTRAATGFFSSLGLDVPSFNELQSGEISGVSVREVKGSEYLFASVEQPGCATADILSRKLPGLILGLEFPKKMRWNELEIAFARPIRWIVALFDTSVIPFAVGPIVSGRQSWGHRQLAPESVSIDQPSTYLETLRSRKVIADVEERRDQIDQQLQVIEKEYGVHAAERDRVLAQVVNLVEWPALTATDFDSAFLSAPKEVLISEMVEHQKYFPLLHSDGSLANSFVITANNTPSDHIRSGNKKVLSARLSDGTFLFQQDLKTPMSKWNEVLKNTLFQKSLGSVFEKTQRMCEHASLIFAELQRSNMGHFKGNLQMVLQAAKLCKADLASEVVKEFPDLQGIMGRHYALAQGEDLEVAQAIEEHWMPKGENGTLPQSTTGMLVGISDKVDNLLGCFLTGLKPTSSSDPYALRRQVLGLIRMLIQWKWRLPLPRIFRQCCRSFPENLKQDRSTALDEIESFVTARVKTVFLDYGFAKDEIEASLHHGLVDIYETFCKVQALHQFRKQEEKFLLLMEVFRRAKGQIDKHPAYPFSDALLTESAEKALDHALNTLQGPFETACSQHQYDEAYEMIAEIQPRLATLFDEVHILAQDERLRKNRIALLQRVLGFFERLVDFGKIQVEKKSVVQA